MYHQWKDGWWDNGWKFGCQKNSDKEEMSYCLFVFMHVSGDETEGQDAAPHDTIMKALENDDLNIGYI